MRTVANLSAVWCGLATIVASLSASPVTLGGTLRDTAGKGIDGTIMVVPMKSGIDISHYRVDAFSSFKIESEARGSLVVHSSALGHASSEIIVPGGTSGTVSLNLLLPATQDVEGRAVDVRGSGIPGAALQLRYSTPGKPNRPVSLYGGGSVRRRWPLHSAWISASRFHSWSTCTQVGSWPLLQSNSRSRPVATSPSKTLP